jgi:hypothetical protein
MERQMSTKTMWAKIGLLSAMALGAAPMWAQETEPASTSTLASIALPQGAVRVSKGSVPAEITDALATMMRSAGAGVRRGRTEVIAWVGGGYSLSKVPRLKSQVGAAFKKGGWTYEEAKPEPGSEGFTMVSALKTAPTRKALIGFWAPDKDALLLAWTEMLPAANAQPEAPAEPEAPADATTEPEAQAEPEVEDAKAKPATVAAPVGATVIEAGAGQLVVNVGKGLPEPRVTFAKLAPLPGKVRGFVKGSDAKPLKGALIGVRSTAVGGAETGAEGKTDAKGYYEISVPFGAAGFYASGYTADYGEGIVALGLQPADGEADEFATPKGTSRTGSWCRTASPTAPAFRTTPSTSTTTSACGLILYFHDENSMYQVKKSPSLDHRDHAHAAGPAARRLEGARRHDPQADY